MKKYSNAKLLILNDDDMNCKTGSDIEKMQLTDIGFSMFAIQDYDMVIYEGKKGMKILKSRYTQKKGVVT